MIYQNTKVSNALKKRFVSEIREIVWQYKLSKDTINVAPKDGIMEIQVFKITLKAPELCQDILKVIDKAIPYPIFYRLLFENLINRVNAYKRILETNAGNCSIVEYFETGWSKMTGSEMPLPVTLNLKSLYEQILGFYIGLSMRDKETIDELVERAQLIRKKQREIQTLEGKMAKEKQFNRKVEINTKIRTLNAELKGLQ